MSQRLGNGLLCTLRRRQGHRMADLFEVTRTDGVVRRFTGLDRPVPFQGEEFKSLATAERMDESVQASLGAGESEIAGFFHPDVLTQREVRVNAWNEARIRHWVVDWKRPWKYYRRAVYWVDEVRQDGVVWRAAVSSINRRLVPYTGRLFERICDYVLGDPATCKKDVSAWVIAAGVVDTVQSPKTTFRATSGSWPSPQPDRFYQDGSIRWTSGNNAGFESRIAQWVQATREVTLAVPTPFVVKPGDGFSARPGCDGSAPTCKDRYNNLPNFGQNQYQSTERDKLQQVRRFQ